MLIYQNIGDLGLRNSILKAPSDFDNFHENSIDKIP